MRSGRGNHATPATLAGIIGSLTALAVVLILPALRTHHFFSAYRPVEISQAAARHCSLDLNEDRIDSGIERIAHEPSPDPILPPAIALTITSPPATVPATPLRLSFVLKRLRLGSGRAPDLPIPA
ncbi:MAG: hypothetical protein ACLQAT_20545 [Candidatus Binataceae bacterium]